MEQQLGFCTTQDGVSIAYATVGEGPPLVICNGGWESFANEYVDQVEAHRLAWRGHTTVRYDLRGVGLSDRDAEAYDLDRTTADLEMLRRYTASYDAEKAAQAHASFSPADRLATLPAA